jgi:hypothetical protein
MSESPRYDVILVPVNRTQRIAEGLVRSLVRYLAGRRIATPRDEALARTWCEIYFAPETAAHDVFLTGAYTGETPVFQEAAIFWADQPVALDYPGLPGSTFYLELRGCLFPAPMGHFLTKFGEVTNLRPMVHHRPHAGLPPHRVVPPGEEHVDAKKRGPGAGLGVAGTRVEEW